MEIWAQLEAARGEANEQKCQLATAQVSSSFRRRRGVLGLEESGTITELLFFLPLTGQVLHGYHRPCKKGYDEVMAQIIMLLRERK